MKKLAALGFLLASISGVHGAELSFNGTVQAGNLTGHPWVFGSTMWGTLDTVGGTFTGQSGFASLVGKDLNLLTFSFGNLELTSFQSPGGVTAGFENYTAGNLTPLPFQISYNGSPWASGIVFNMRTDVQNTTDINAVGSGLLQLTSGGVDPTFYNEVLSLSNNTGLMAADISAFTAVNNAGLFSSVGTLTPVPEPAAWAGLTALVTTVCVLVHRRQRKRGG